MTFFCPGGLSGFVHGLRSRLESLRRAAPSHPRAAGLVIASLLAASASPAWAQVEGYGKDATGGAGKPVCTVTSSAAEGPGTWDSCVNGGGNQIIQFAVPSATVRAVSYLRSNTTVDGCANGPAAQVSDDRR